MSYIYIDQLLTDISSISSNDFQSKLLAVVDTVDTCVLENALYLLKYGISEDIILRMAADKTLTSPHLVELIATSYWLDPPISTYLSFLTTT